MNNRRSECEQYSTIIYTQAKSFIWLFFLTIMHGILSNVIMIDKPLRCGRNENLVTCIIARIMVETVFLYFRWFLYLCTFSIVWTFFAIRIERAHTESTRY